MPTLELPESYASFGDPSALFGWVVVERRRTLTPTARLLACDRQAVLVFLWRSRNQQPAPEACSSGRSLTLTHQELEFTWTLATSTGQGICLVWCELSVAPRLLPANCLSQKHQAALPAFPRFYRGDAHEGFSGLWLRENF